MRTIIFGLILGISVNSLGTPLKECAILAVKGSLIADERTHYAVLDAYSAWNGQDVDFMIRVASEKGSVEYVNIKKFYSDDGVLKSGTKMNRLQNHEVLTRALSYYGSEADNNKSPLLRVVDRLTMSQQNKGELLFGYNHPERRRFEGFFEKDGNENENAILALLWNIDTDKPEIFTLFQLSDMNQILILNNLTR